MFLVAVKVALLAAVYGVVLVGASPAEFFVDAVDKGPYEGWLEGRGAAYERSTFLPASADRNQGAAVFWTIHDVAADGTALSRTSGSKPWIQFAVAVQATGWVGFGLSEAGGMRGSDMVIWDSQDPTNVRDAYVIEERFPEDDDCANWDLLKATFADGWIILEVARNLDTGDSQDRPFVDDSSSFAGTRLISAWGDGAFGYHGTNVVRREVRLFSEESDGAITVETNHQLFNSTADGSLKILARDFSTPTGETTYHISCFTYQDLLDQVPGIVEGQSITVIGFAPIIMPETESLVHHFTVFGSEQTDACEMIDFLAGWAPGDSGLAMPSNVGIPIFGEDQPKSIMVEIHYHNPNGVQNMTDSSGLQLYFTLEPREFAAGVLQVGDPAVSLNGTQVGAGLSEWTFECDSNCSSFALSGESVTVLQESLHMHMTGTRMVNELIRDGEVVHTSAVDVFDFHQQGSYRVPMIPYEVKPGDAFRTSCYYRDGNVFGLGSADEMCISFILYYPAKRLTFPDFSFPWFCGYGFPAPVCFETLTSRTLAEDVDLGRAFGTLSSESCENTSDGSNLDQDNPEPGEDGSSSGLAGWSIVAVPTLVASLMMVLW